MSKYRYKTKTATRSIVKRAAARARADALTIQYRTTWLAQRIAANRKAV